MKKFSYFLTVLSFVILLASATPGLAQSPQQTIDVSIPQSTSTTNTIFLPLVGGGMPPTSIELIDAAVANGQISAEQGLIDKVFAVWGDPRLPAQFIGSPDENAGDRVMREVAEQVATLSNSAKEILTPFFLPPTDPDSWWQANRPAASLQRSQADTWQSISAAGGKVKVWYTTVQPDAARQAGVVQAAIDGAIWSKETTLMGREPKYGPDPFNVLNIFLWHSYVKGDGITVPFNGTRGITLAPECQNSYSWIYVDNSRPDGDETHPGIIQTVAHEMFHALQFSYTLKSCKPYDWMAEATSKWVEDYVYPKANSEWDYAHFYLDRPYLRLDDLTDRHQYGAYLFFFFLTHQYADAKIVRRAWENGATYDNSYLAIKYALPSQYQDSFWGAYLLTLWNQLPYPIFYQIQDQLTKTVKGEWASPVQVTAGDKEFIKSMPGDLPTGAVRYYHFTFPDNSVHSLTFLNGLAYKLRKDSIMNSIYDTSFTLQADQTYTGDQLSADQMKGIVTFSLMKVAGKSTWDLLPSGAGVDYPYCMDLQGKIEDLIVLQSNGDFDHPDRVLAPQGLATMLYASNVPCGKYQGTSKVTVYNGGPTWTYNASNVTYVNAFNPPDVPVFPFVQLYLMGANVSWTVSGQDAAGCTYSGSGSYQVGPHPEGSVGIWIFTGILPGSPTYRGYIGQGDADPGTTISYTVKCKGGTLTSSSTPNSFLKMPLMDDRANIKIPANGILQGSYKQTDAYGNWTLYEWNLSPVFK